MKQVMRELFVVFILKRYVRIVLWWLLCNLWTLTTFMCSFVTVGPLFGGGFGASSGAYAFSVPGLPPAAHALAKTSFLFDHGNYALISAILVNHPRHPFMFLYLNSAAIRLNVHLFLTFSSSFYGQRSSLRSLMKLNAEF